MNTSEKQYYYRNLEIGFISTLVVLILIFYIFPRLNQPVTDDPQYTVPTIEVLYIPSTTQKIDRRPKPVKPYIPVESDDIELLDNVEIEELVQGDSAALSIISGPVQYTELPYTPRQLFDVIPEKTDEPVSGLIILSLRVGVDGDVKDYKVLQNTTNNKMILNNVVKAAMQSKWESAVLKNQKVEYWINKTYRFK